MPVTDRELLQEARFNAAAIVRRMIHETPKETAYIDHINNRWEGRTYTEDGQVTIATRRTRAEIINILERMKYRVVDTTATPITGR